MTCKVTSLVCAGLFVAAGAMSAADAENERDRGSLAEFPEGAQGGTHVKGYVYHGATTAPANLINHSTGYTGVLPASNFYFIWWGSWPSPPSLPTSTQVLLQNFAGNLGTRGVPLFNMMDQYLSSTTPCDTCKMYYYSQNDITDTTAPPSRGPSTSTIVGEVCKVTGNNPDPAGIYAVMASNFPKAANYCAWHAWGSCSNGKPVQVTYQPNPKGVAGCDAGVSPNNDQQADSTANVLSHEIFETITDPRGKGWYDKNGQEIGDKCAWKFAPLTGANYTNTVGTDKYYIQEEWDNSHTGCVQLAE